MTRYQKLITKSSSTYLKFELAIWSPRVNSSGTDATKASDVVFSIEIVSLPVGGMMTRIACGSTTPSVIPITMAATVRTKVSLTPSKMSRWKRNCQKVSQCRRGAVTTVFIAATARRRTTTAESHRHGWRTGTALIASGRRPAGELDGPEVISVTSGCQLLRQDTHTAPTELLSFSFTSEVEMAPSATPHLLRTCL